MALSVTRIKPGKASSGTTSTAVIDNESVSGSRHPERTSSSEDKLGRWRFLSQVARAELDSEARLAPPPPPPPSTTTTTTIEFYTPEISRRKTKEKKRKKRSPTRRATSVSHSLRLEFGIS